MSHLPVLPIVLPLALGAVMLLLPRGAIAAQRALAFAGALAQVALALLLVRHADSGEVTAYLVSNWEAHIGRRKNLS